MLMEGDPFVLIEGMTIAGSRPARRGLHLHALGISARAKRALEAAIAAARGAYLGETSRAAASASIWKCAWAPAPMSAARRPRCSKASRASAAGARKPPLPAHQGLFGKPTVINNVLSPSPRCRSSWTAAAPSIRLRHGPLARHAADPARRQHQAAACRELAFGMTLRELLDDFGGGTLERPADPRGAGRRPARRLFPAARSSTRRFDYEAFAAIEGLLGHGGIVVFDDTSTWRAGALRHGVLRDRILRQMHALPHRLDAASR
jgi:formate dehydrogenase iron-sulfur subunit